MIFEFGRGSLAAMFSAALLFRYPKKFEFTSSGVDSDGNTLAVNGTYKLLRCVDGGQPELLDPGVLRSYSTGIRVDGKDFWALGEGALAHSTDGGKTFKAVKLPIEWAELRVMAVGGDGAFWLGGADGNGDGVVFVGDARGKAFRNVEGPTASVCAMTRTKQGVLLAEDNGTLWIGAGGKLTKAKAGADGAVHSILETDRGTVIAFAGKTTVLRSTDGAKSFASSAFKGGYPLTLAQMPNGPIVVGGWDDLLAVSTDDGKTFQKLKHTVGSKQKFEFSCVHGEDVVLAGTVQNVVAVTATTSTKTKEPAKKAPAAKPSAARASPKGYVASGTFKSELEAMLGKLKPHAKRKARFKGFDDELARVPAAVASEVEALFELCATYKLPKLCGLREGGFTSMPAQYDADASEWFRDKKDAALVEASLEIFDDQGSPFVIVGARGVALFYEDPYGVHVVADDLKSFLGALIAVEAAAKGKLTVPEAKKRLAASIHKYKGQYPQLFTRALEG